MSHSKVQEMLEVPEPQSGEDPQVLVSELIRTFPRDRRFSAREIVLQYPVLGDDRGCLIDLAWEEFCRLRESGNDIRPAEFARQFREIEQSLYRVMEFDQLLHDHPSYIEGIPEDRWPVPGNTFCGYELLEQLGRGAFSRVFVARQPTLGSRRVVAKICFRGENEACLLGQLSHPAIAMVHSVHTEPDSGLSVICMPYETRVTLHYVSEVLHRTSRSSQVTAGQIESIVGRFNAEDSRHFVNSGGGHRSTAAVTVTEVAAAWGISLAEALDAAHQRKILHCDVKPGNVLVLNDLSVKLLDFNLASEDGARQTLVGGTLPFMASEQLKQVAAADGEFREVAWRMVETDVYGLCATLWYFLLGAPPFGVHLDSESRQASAQNLLERQRRGISESDVARAAAMVSRAVLDVLLQGLQFEPEARPRTALQLAHQLREALASVTAARDTPVAAPTVAPKSPSRSRRLVRLTGLAATVTAAALVLTFAIPSDEQRTMRQVQQLVEAGQYSQAQDVLADFLKRDPANQLASARLAWLKFSDLFHRSAKLTPPADLLMDAARDDQKSSRRNETSPQLQLWLAMVDEWMSLKSLSQVADAARVNAAIMLSEVGRISDCEDLLNERPADSAYFPVEDRQRTCLQLIREFQNHSASSPQMISAIRGVENQTLSRLETRTLMSLLARHLSAKDANATDRIPGLSIDDGARVLLSVVDSAARTHVSNSDLKLLMYWSMDQAPPYVKEKISWVIANGNEFPQNPLSGLLVAPRDIPEIASLR